MTVESSLHSTQKAFLALLVVITALLVVASLSALGAKWHQAQMASYELRDREGTMRRLEHVGESIRLGRKPRPCGPDDQRGERALWRTLHAFFVRFDDLRMDAFLSGQGGDALKDDWNNPIYYRCPGPIHTHGWDLISCGPNGIYEEGQGDDIVVGEDLPPEEFAAIMSGTTTAPVTTQGSGR